MKTNLVRLNHQLVERLSSTDMFITNALADCVKLLCEDGLVSDKSHLCHLSQHSHVYSRMSMSIIRSYSASSQTPLMHCMKQSKADHNKATTIHWLFQTQSQNSPLFTPRLTMFPTLLYTSASDSSSLEFVRYINSVIIILIIIIIIIIRSSHHYRKSLPYGITQSATQQWRLSCHYLGQSWYLIH